MSETIKCPFCGSKAVVVCRVDSDWGVELKYKLLNDVSNYDIDSMIEFENYDIDFPSGDYGDIYVYRCQSCRAEWGDGVDVDIADLNARIAELEAERDDARAIVEKLIEAIRGYFFGEEPSAVWRKKLSALVSEWKEMQK